MADRAASEVLSFAMVFALVLASVTVVSVGGLESLQTARDAEQLDNAERAFDVLADNFRDVHQRGAPSRATEISLGSGELYTGANVTVEVSANRSDGGWDNVSREVRPLVYGGENERVLTYEGGGVFRKNRYGGRALVDPPFVFRDDRVLLTLVAPQTSTVESHGDATVLVRTNREDRAVPIHGGDYDDVYLNVTSPRRNQWQRYLRTETEAANCGPNGDDEAYVVCRYDDPGQLHVVVYDLGLTIER
ncbi:DUF7289 family protein [Halomicrobium urmianum]|uniref:DUF7289 family protein n=1 Tax=Halomicrobium urmianum TaxID=1586233 RepID=UPI001CD944C3|nr:hypothetical protein [Halomicrobium urmianum]